MADQKISDLTGDTGSLTDHIAVAEGTSANKKVLLSALVTLFQSATQTFTNKTINDFSNFIDADRLHHPARNVSGSTITKGTPVFDSGYNIGLDIVEIEPADADSASTMPAGGLVEVDISNNVTGSVISSGILSGIDTNSFDVGDGLYVSGTVGTLTNVKPTGTAMIQKIAIVLRKHASMGVVIIIPSLRTNDIPNIPEDNLWVGNSSAVPTANTMTQLLALIAAVATGQEWTAQQNFNAATLTGLGPDQVLDGDMGTTGSWTEQETGWTVNDAVAGEADCTGAQGGDADLGQTPATALVSGKTYQVIYDVTTYVAGNVTPVIGGTEGTDRSSTGTDIIEYIVAGGGSDIQMRGDVNFDGAIDNVRVKLANVSWDLDTAQVATLTLDGNLVLDNPANMNDGGQYILRILQDGTGSRLLTYGSVYKFPGGSDPTLSTGASERDKIGFDSNGTLMDGNFAADYS